MLKSTGLFLYLKLKGCDFLPHLIITEKPSVARTISKVLGATARRDGYLEGGGWLVSWCVGHLVELAPPGAYDPRLERWDRADLPILPERWQYLVSSSTKKQFDILCKLMHRADVDRIICATDAGREGELIFRLVYHQCNCRKPVSRLWISSMEDAAIRAGFANLKPSTEYDSLYKAALCRERADWLVGINATRLFSCLHGVTLNVGRVMTPTLAMTVEREAAIAAFHPEPFYTIFLQMEGYMASSERFKDKTQAEDLLAKCRKSSQALVQKSERKEKSERPPALYDLTTLQRDANRLLGYSAQQTLDYTQSLYEKKLITYPRTDSRYLTEDMAAGLPGLVMDTAVAFGFRGAIPVHAKQVIRNQKVSDHHAILPTQSVAGADLSSLPVGEASILHLIAARLLAAVGEPYRYAETTVQIECAGQTFTAKGKTVLDEGWKAVERVILGNSAEKVEETLEILTEAQDKETLPVRDAQLKEGRTTPPKHFTEDTLLAAMETAGAETKVNCPNGAREGALGYDPGAPTSLKAATSYARSLQTEVFPDLRVGLVHGKMKPREKDAVMTAFAGGELDVLVSTTVIEVGVDVPNAALMVVENADRFGLSQLHQLRGRVGRGKHQSYCVLVTSTRNPDSRARLKVLTKTTDGFQIAEEDLKLRGPGDFFGQRQHGLPQLRIADLAGDMRVLKEAQLAAQELLERDPGLKRPEHAPLLKQIHRLFEQHGDMFN